MCSNNPEQNVTFLRKHTVTALFQQLTGKIYIKTQKYEIVMISRKEGETYSTGFVIDLTFGTPLPQSYWLLKDVDSSDRGNSFQDTPGFHNATGV
ncbi:hypothetical protein CEXT_637161 [Caerostris extrusa]|uniref:Uncharacterized protein n=1 Tax=Caerostris extrusa TaxID=172846 RepID=A0AAV4TCX7_CAEEX|nr:hypothetical protein CEXT_637161 [Caerostris extrusa]